MRKGYLMIPLNTCWVYFNQMYILNLVLFLHEYADVSPTKLPAEVPPVYGIADQHHIKLQEDTKPICIPLYRHGTCKVRTSI